MLYLQIGEVTPGSFFLRLNSSRLTIRSKLVLAKFEGRDEAGSWRALPRSSPMASSTIMRANLPSTMPMMIVLPGALYILQGRSGYSRAMFALGPGCEKTRFWWEGLGRIDGADFRLGLLLS
jgi:hypothetical protein